MSQAPDNREGRSLLGRLEMQLGNPTRAEGELLKAIELGTPAAEVAVELAEAYLLLHKFDEVEAIEVTELSGTERARVLGYQAEAALAQGEISRAFLLAKNAVETNPVSAEALTISARLQLLEPNVPVARTYLSTALDQTPDYAQAWELLGDIEASEQRLPEALSAYSRSVDTASNILSPLFKRASVHLALNNLESASDDLKIFAENDINSPAVMLLRSEILLREDKLIDAQVVLEKTLQNAPDYLPAVRTLAITHMLNGNLGQAEQFAKQYSNATYSDESRVLLASIRLQANRFDQAEQTLLPLRESARLSILGAQVLATALLKQDKLDDAVNTMLTLHGNLLRAGVNDKTPLAVQTDPAVFMSAELLGIKNSTLSTQTGENYLSKRELKIIEATTALAELDIPSAMKSATALLESRPNDAGAHTLVGRIHAAEGDTTAAMAALNKAMALQENPGTAVIVAATLAMNNGEFDSARAMLIDAFGGAKGPARERILLSLATVDASAGDEAQALMRLKQARFENPASYHASLALANYYTNKSAPEDVLKSLSELATTDAQNPGVVELTAQAYIELKQFDKAISVLTPMVQKEPDSPRWRYMRSMANAGNNDLEAVNRDLDAALRIDANHTGSVLAKANLSILTNDMDQAEFHLSQLESLVPGSDALKLLSSRVESARNRNAQTKNIKTTNKSPGNTEEVINYAQKLWIAGDQESSLDTLINWLNTNPDDNSVRLTLANIYMAQGSFEDAAAAYQVVLQKDKNNFVALNNLAWQMRHEDPKTAISYATRAVALQPKNASALDTLAVIQFEHGLLAEAGENFEKIRVLKTQDPTILYHGARIQAALGEKLDAKKILEVLINNDVDFPDAEAAQELYDRL